jgi:hypothetical protein
MSNRKNLEARATQVGLKLSWHKPGGVGKTVYALGKSGDFQVDDRNFCGTLRDCDAYVSGYAAHLYEKIETESIEELMVRFIKKQQGA